MPETIALFRLVWNRDRKLVLIVSAAAMIGTLLSVLAAGTLPTDRLSFMPAASLRDIAVASTMLLTLVPAIITTFGLFNFQSQEESLEFSASCCSHWLLRMPIKSWKIVAVPVVLKTFWIACCWMLLSIPIGRLSASGFVPWVEPSLSLSTIAITGLAVTWRPFRSGWRRILTVIVASALSLGLFSLAFVRTSAQYEDWQWLVAAGLVTTYAASVWLLLNSVQLGRTNPMGLIPSTRRFAPKAGAHSSRELKRIEHRGVSRALIWHDISRATRLNAVVIGIFMIPTIIFVLSIGLKGATVFIALMMSAIASWSAIAGSMYPLNQKLGTVLPLYMVASPIPSYRIAWTRLVSSLLIMVPFLLLTLCILAMFMLWPDNRTEWMRWSQTWARNLGSEEQVFWTGIRISVAAVIGSIIAMYGRIFAFLWISMLGRDWLAGIVGCLVGAMILGAIIVPISWFFRYENLDEVKAAAMWWLAQVPTILALLLVVKIAFASIAGFLLDKRKLAPGSAVARTIWIWAAIVAVVGVAMYALIPAPQATLFWCLGATAVFVPLGSILWMPISVDGDRHR
tara:strand:+ start:605103 stop:606806 length:1704 start_codon:yes stop_codon:yes gene_type:complete